MENFPIIQALCRASLANPSQAVIRQVERLRDALEKDGFKNESKKLDGLLSSMDKTCDMAPSKIQRSGAFQFGEDLAPNTPMPVDKETSTPLAEIVFPDSLPGEPPLFDSNVEVAIRSILNEWNHFEELLKIEAHPVRSCLIYGPPGTGKTHLALWVAKQLGVPVVTVRLDGLMSSFLGTTSRNIGNLFSFAAKYRCILLLDEFDAIAKLRNDSQEVGEIKRVVNTLLQNLDARKNIGFTIGITNHEALLDPAIWRRFDVQIEIPKPPHDVMVRIIKKFMKPLDFDEKEIKLLAWCIEGSSGADAKSLVQWLKKSSVLGNGKTSDLFLLLKRFVLLNSGRIDPIKRNLFAQTDEELGAALIQDSRYGFKQKEIAVFMGVTPSALSRKLTKLKEAESESTYVK